MTPGRTLIAAALLLLLGATAVAQEGEGTATSTAGENSAATQPMTQEQGAELLLSLDELRSGQTYANELLGLGFALVVGLQLLRVVVTAKANKHLW